MDKVMHHILSYVMIAVFGLMFAGADPVLAAGTEDTATDTKTGAAAYATAKSAVDAKDYATAKPILVQLTVDEPGNADAWNLLGYSNRKMGNMDAAAVAYKTALKINPGHLGALEYQGEMYLEMGKADEARTNLEALQSLCGTCDEALDLQQAIADAGV